MFIDLTPGTPPIYREEVLRKLLTVGYDLDDHLVFGTDCMVNAYDAGWAEKWVAMDGDIMDKLGVDEQDKSKIFSGNLLRFIGEV